MRHICRLRNDELWASFQGRTAVRRPSMGPGLVLLSFKMTAQRKANSSVMQKEEQAPG